VNKEIESKRGRREGGLGGGRGEKAPWVGMVPWWFPWGGGYTLYKYIFRTSC